MARVGADGEVEAVFCACECRDGERGERLLGCRHVVRIVQHAGQVSARDEQRCIEHGFGGDTEDACALAHARIPHLDDAGAFCAEAEEAVCWVDVDGIASGGLAEVSAAEHKWREEAALIEIEAVDLSSCGGYDGISRGEVVAESAAKLGDADASMRAALCLELDGSVGLKMKRLCPVVGEHLSQQQSKKIAAG